MSLPRLATDAQLDRLLDASLDVLERTGVLFQDPGLVARLLAAGCAEGIDGRTLIPRAVVDAMLAPRLADPAPAPDGPPRRRGATRAHIGCQIAQFYLDHQRRERLPSTRALLVEMARFGHVWQPDTPVGPVLLCRDVSPPVEPMEAVLALAENTNRVASGYVHYAEQVPFMMEMGRILVDDPRHFVGVCVFTVTPLRLDHRACRLLTTLSEAGAPVWIGTQPAAGASSPVTPAGTVVLAAAEILAGWVAGHTVNPELMPGAGICSGVLDMRTADVSYSAPESMLQDLLCVELFRERLGGRCGLAGGAGYTDAKWPGTQKGFETAFEALIGYAYTAGGPGAGSGLLESGKTFSPVQFILDDDMQRHLWTFACGVDLSDDALALQVVHEVAHGLGSTHLGTDHTLSRWRDIYHPNALDRGCWQGDAQEAAGETALLDRAWRRFELVRALYEPADVGEDKLQELRAVVADARRLLCEGLERTHGTEH